MVQIRGAVFRSISCRAAGSGTIQPDGIVYAGHQGSGTAYVLLKTFQDNPRKNNRG